MDLLWEEGVALTTMIARLGPKSCMVNIYHMFIYWQEHYLYYHIILSNVYFLNVYLSLVYTPFRMSMIHIITR